MRLSCIIHDIHILIQCILCVFSFFVYGLRVFLYFFCVFVWYLCLYCCIFFKGCLYLLHYLSFCVQVAIYTRCILSRLYKQITGFMFYLLFCVLIVIACYFFLSVCFLSFFFRLCPCFHSQLLNEFRSFNDLIVGILGYFQ